jgi:hypothetical protein
MVDNEETTNIQQNQHFLPNRHGMEGFWLDVQLTASHALLLPKSCHVPVRCLRPEDLERINRQQKDNNHKIHCLKGKLR